MVWCCFDWVNVLDQISSGVLSVDLFVLVPLFAPVRSLPGGSKCPKKPKCERSELTAGKWKFNFTRHLLLARIQPCRMKERERETNIFITKHVGGLTDNNFILQYTVSFLLALLF